MQKENYNRNYDLEERTAKFGEDVIVLAKKYQLMKLQKELFLN